MSERTVQDMILDNFALLIADDTSFSPIRDELLTAIRQKQGKNKIRELLRKLK
jgi:hypothetical protein